MSRERTRREFVRGRWVIASAPRGPDDTREIASILVQTRPERLLEVEASIGRISATEIHHRDPRGKLVVVIEGDDKNPIGQALTEISSVAHVLSATLVFHAIDAETQSPVEKGVAAHE